MPKRYTKKSLISRFKEIHGNLYSYNLNTFKNVDSKIAIKCPQHGWFEQTPASHISGSGCHECSKISTKDKLRKDADLFKKQLNLISPNIKVIGKYVNNVTNILVETKYGICNAKPCNLLKGDSPGIKSSINKDEFCIKKFRDIHGDRYSYDKFKYNGSRFRSIITCRIHGDFKCSTDNHNRGKGCPKCGEMAKYLYKNSINVLNIDKIPCYLYILEFSSKNEIFWKIGITNNLKSRLRSLKCSSKHSYKVSIIDSFLTSYSAAYFVEQGILSRHKSSRYRPNIRFDGWTECMSIKPTIPRISKSQFQRVCS